MRVLKGEFGKKGYQTVYSFTLINDNGMEISCINYGCIITKIMTPDHYGNFENVVIGHNSLDKYLSDSYFLGAIIGRVAGRIRARTFELDGKAYTLANNENNNHLHGGTKGFNQVLWDAESFENEQEIGCVFSI